MHVWFSEDMEECVAAVSISSSCTTCMHHQIAINSQIDVLHGISQQLKVLSVVRIHVANARCAASRKLGCMAAFGGVCFLLPLSRTVVSDGAPLLPADAPLQAGCVCLSLTVDRIQHRLQVLLQ
jgi:hypothetical protein